MYGSRIARLWALLLMGCLGGIRPAHAILDVENRGPQLTAGAFAMRITNIGAIGNPFESVGRSFDPSFEYPRGSGQELLEHAELWVAATPVDGPRRVSGGPLLEWRPTLDPEDRVRIGYAGTPGSRRWFDDDGDGRVDEEFLDGRDDDGDGEIDEDLGLEGTEVLTARYTDDQPEAVQYGYGTGESHVPLGLDVKQSAFTWAIPGYDHVAGLTFTIHNHGRSPLKDVRVGLLANLDVRSPGSAGGHVDDMKRDVPFQGVFFDGVSRVPSVFRYDNPSDPTPYFKECFATLAGTAHVVEDANVQSHAPAVALLPLWHTTDPLGLLVEQGRVSAAIIEPFRSAPTQVAFRSTWFAADMPPGQGGLPIIDADRSRALEGSYPGLADTLRAHDYMVLVSCGPFPRLAPGQSVEVHFAFVASEPESLGLRIQHALSAHHGGFVNLLPDTTFALWRDFRTAVSGITGHEVCYEPPAGLDFVIDPHCVQKYAPDPVTEFLFESEYAHGHCVWTDMDCDVCTGFDGNETAARWRDPSGAPQPPAFRTVPGDDRVTVQWDDRAEVLTDVGPWAASNVKFVGYNIYRLDDWRSRRSDLPQLKRFQQVASFGRDPRLGARPLAEVTDPSVEYDRILYERKVHPIGRYRWPDTRAINGFDYVYAVTAVSERTLGTIGGVPFVERLESPILAALDSIVTPSIAAGSSPRGVWVVPNPLRGSAPWDRPRVPGDVFARHVDFYGLPRARSRIRIYTLAGDLVQTLDHDGTTGAGQARWDLISRNGQEVASGVYLFTVEGGASRQQGRFVILR